MKRGLLITMLFGCVTVFAKNIYVAKDGNDNNTGTEGQPYLTIQKAADIMVAGDACYIKEGVYREEVIVKSNNVSFLNYQNDKVVVSGADLVTGWTASSQGDGIYEAFFPGSETDFTMLFMNGKRQGMARWPNNTGDEMLMPEDKSTGYEDCQVFEGVAGQKSRQATFPNMSGFPNDFFKGGIFRGINGKKWINPMGVITASSGSNVTVDAITDGWIDNSEKIFTDSGKGFGFILHLNALDREGEWFQQGNKVYFMPPVGTNPNNLSISTKNRKWAFVISGNNNVTVDGLNIHAASIEMKISSDCKILNTSVQYLYPFLTRKGYGVSLTEQGGVLVKGDNNLFKNCYIAHSWGHGILIEEGLTNRIENCVIEDIGWIAQFTSSVQNLGRGTVLTKSTLGSTGRFHVRTQDKIDVTYCDLFDCMKMGQDAGSIQCTNGGDWGNPVNMRGAEIAYNRIHDCNTLTDGHKEFVLAFYLEGSYNYSVHHNLVYNFITDEVPDGTFAYLGPRKANITDCYYYNNTVWNMDWGVRLWNRDDEGEIDNTRFWNNIMDSRAKDDVNNSNERLYDKIDNKNNIRNLTGNGNVLFVDASNGDFRLKDGSEAIDAGREIAGITDGFSGSMPDVGAIEYGQDFPEVGADLTSTDFGFGDYIDGNVINVEPIITFLNPQSEIIQSQTINIDVEYSVGEEAELVAVFTSPDGTWLGNDRVIVQASEASSRTLVINLSEMPESNVGYKINVSIRPVGGNASTSFDDQTQLVDVLLITAFKGEVNEEGLSIYPNPTTGKVKISEETAWTVYSSLGIVIAQGQSKEVDLSDFPTGVYLLKSKAITVHIIKE